MFCSHEFSLDPFCRSQNSTGFLFSNKENEAGHVEIVESNIKHQVPVANLGSRAPVKSKNNKQERDLKAFNEFVIRTFEKFESYVLIQSGRWKLISSTLLDEIAALNSKLDSIVDLNTVRQIPEEVLNQSFQINECLLVYCSNILEESSQNLRNLTGDEIGFVKEATTSFSLICKLIYRNLVSKSLCTDERMERLTLLVCEILNKYLCMKDDPQNLGIRIRSDLAASARDFSNIQESNKNRNECEKGTRNQKELISCQILPVLVANSAKMVRHLSLLILSIKISEPFILRIIKASFSVLTSSDAELLKANVVQMVTHIFNRYSNLRSNIIEKIIEIIVIEICGGDSYSRLFYIPEDSTRKISVITAALLSCLQSCVGYHDDTSDISNKILDEGVAHAFHWSNIFWSRMLVKVSQLHERDSRKFIPKLVEDLLVCLNLPEWPVSSLTLLNFCALLLGKFGLQHKDPKFRERALDVISQVCAKLRSDSLSCEICDTSFSYEDNSSISNELTQASADIRSISISGEKLSKTQSICIEGILIRYLLNNIKDCSSMDLSKRNDYFMCDNVRCRLHNALIFQICQMTNKIKRHPKCDFSEMKSNFYWNLYNTIKMNISTMKGAVGKNRALSRNSIIILNRQLQVHGPLAQQIDILFHRVIGMLDDVSITVRTTGIRSLSRIVSMDPSVLLNPRIHQILSKRITDPATLVRCSVIELIGQFICSNEEVRLMYWSKILDRINDVGVSVRKRVIMIMQEIALDADNGSSIYFNYRLALRIMDTDLNVQLLVIQYFRKKWFHATGVTSAQRQDAWLVFVKLAWHMHSNFFLKLDSKLPTLSDFPLLFLLQRILQPAEGEVQSDAIDMELLKKNGYGMIVYIFEGLVNSTELELQSNTNIISMSDIQTGNLMQTSEKTLTPEMFAFSLNMFALIEPSFLVPENDPFYFLIGLEPYLHRSKGIKESKSTLIQSVLSIINEIACYNSRISMNLCQTIVDDVCILILCSKNSGIVDYATKCLTSFASLSIDSREKLKRLTRALMLILSRESKLDEERKILKSRAIFILGKVLRYISKEFLESNHSSLFCVEISESEPTPVATLLEIFRKYIFIEDKCTNVNKNALEACGSLLLSAQTSIYNIPECLLILDDIVYRTLSTSNSDLKMQAMKNLEGVLCKEDSNFSSIFRKRNQNVLSSSTGFKERNLPASIQGENGELDHSNAVYVQRYWKEILRLCADRDPQVRFKALHLIEIILRKGLVHPLSAFIILLESNFDESRKIRKFALRIFKAQYKKYSDFFFQKLSEAVEELFQFITSKQCESDPSNERKNRGRKPEFFEEFHFNCFKNILDVMTGNRGGAMKVLEVIVKLIKKKVSEATNIQCIKFLSYMISCMTFTSNAEPIYAIYQLHRVIVIHAAELTRKAEEQSELRLSVPEQLLTTNSIVRGQKEAINLSLSLHVILQLKQYLQAKFKISEEQLLSYEQSEKHKNFGQLRVNENIQPMRITVKEAPLNITADVYHEYLYNFMDLVEHFNAAKDRTTQNV